MDIKMYKKMIADLMRRESKLKQQVLDLTMENAELKDIVLDNGGEYTEDFEVTKNTENNDFEVKRWRCDN